MEFFNFGLEKKLDRHSCVEFHSESDGDGSNFPKPQLNPPKCPLGAPKNAIFNFGLEQMLKFHGDSMIVPKPLSRYWAPKFSTLSNIERKVKHHFYNLSEIS